MTRRPSHPPDEPRDYDEIPPRPAERLLVDLVPEIEGDRIVCTSVGLAQFARAVALRLPRSVVSCHYLDLYQADQAHWLMRPVPPNLTIECGPDLPDQPGEIADVVAIPCPAAGEAELVRDRLQAGHQTLKTGGLLVATSDNRKDTWLHDVIEEFFGAVRKRPVPRGVVYTAKKTGPLKKLKNYAAEFAFRDRGRLIKGFSRPGVFAHRKLDVGARHLINAMEIEPGSRVFDIGCGSGGPSLAAALRADGVRVHGIDSNARAIPCVQRGAEANGITTVTAELRTADTFRGAGDCQLALANPPYFGDFKIAALFLTACRSALAPAGKVLLVTKSPEWFELNMGEWFGDVTITPVKRYFIASGVRPRSR